MSIPPGFWIVPLSALAGGATTLLISWIHRDAHKNDRRRVLELEKMVRRIIDCTPLPPEKP